MSNAPATLARKDTRHREMNKFMVIVDKMGIYVIVALLILVGILAAPGKFLSLSNFRSIMQAVSLIGICSVGLSFIVYSANFNDM
ncbi:MAG: ABC transporter permease, partial [Ruthenibacterium sp.]